MHNHNNNREVSRIVKQRSKFRSGAHFVVPRGNLVVGSRTTQKGEEYSTLTQARKAAKIGDAIIRKSDGIVVSVK